MSSLTRNARKWTQNNAWYSSWVNAWSVSQDIATSSGGYLAAECWRAELSFSSQQKLTGCSASVNLKNTVPYSGTVTVYCYLYTSDPTTGQLGTSVPSGYIKSASKAITLGYGAGTFQTFSFSDLNISSGSYLYFLFTSYRASASEPYITLFDYNDGTSGFGTTAVSGTFQSNMALTVSPASVSTGNSVSLTVVNGSGTSCTATIKYGTTTLATETFSNGSCSIPCSKSWFTTAGLTTATSMALDVTVTGGGQTMTGSFTLTAGDDMKPTVATPTAAVVDLTGNFPSTYIAGFSKVSVAAAVTSGSNAAISGVVMSFPGGTSVNASYNSTSEKWEATTAEPITGDVTITMTATDGRGLTGSSSVSITGVVAYTSPSVTIDASGTYRCDSVGAKESGGAYFRAKATANYYSSLSGNTLTKFSVKIKNSASETALTSGVQSGAISGTTNPNQRYTIVFTIQDSISGEITREYILEGALRDFVIKRGTDNNGAHLGIGMTPEITAGKSTIELPAGGGLLIGDILMTTSSTNPGTTIGGTWTAITQSAIPGLYFWERS